MIVHKATGRRFYIVHYGGEDVNIYNVLDYSATTDKFDNGLQVASNANGAKVESRTLSRRDERQQWNIVLQTDKRFMKLKNIMNNILSKIKSVSDNECCKDTGYFLDIINPLVVYIFWVFIRYFFIGRYIIISG